jgi:hypothetical protein
MIDLEVGIASRSAVQALFQKRTNGVARSASNSLAQKTVMFSVRFSCRLKEAKRATCGKQSFLVTQLLESHRHFLAG